MPIYVYGPKSGPGEKRACETCAGTFEIVQRMSEEALTHCPKCGGAIERILTTPSVTGVKRYRKRSPREIAQAGFTQYKRMGHGYYEKQFGQGPRTLHGDQG